MSLQRPLQNGRYAEFSDHSTERLQVGHLTKVATRRSLKGHAQRVNTKGTSHSTCTGRRLVSVQFKNRTVQRC